MDGLYCHGIPPKRRDHQTANVTNLGVEDSPAPRIILSLKHFEVALPCPGETTKILADGVNSRFALTGLRIDAEASRGGEMKAFAFHSKLTSMLRVRKSRDIAIGNRHLALDLTWRHERDYLNWSKRGQLNGPIAFDVLTTERFVRSGDCVLDAGANIGFTALLFLKRGAKMVHAVEPDPRNFLRLSRIASEQVKVFDYALADKNGKITLYLSKMHNQGSTCEERITSRFSKVFDGGRSVTVPVRSIDEAFPDCHFDVMKIDVEGAELALLKGCDRRLAKNPPRVVIIESYEEMFPDIDSLLREAYQYSARVVYDKSQKRLLLLPVETKSETIQGEVYFNPPTYLYSSEPIE